jgi:diacylglycerol kinase family enzyme
MKHLFILNPRSFRKTGKMDSVISSIETWFKETDQENYHIYISRYPRDAIGAIRTFMANAGGDTRVRIYAVGGDGILFDCLNGAVGFGNAELAIMPYGMTNNFMRALGEHKNALFRSVRCQAGGRAIPMDIIRCRGNYTLNFCTIGMESDAIMRAIRINNILEQGGRILRRIYYGLYRYMYYLGDFLAAFNHKVTRQWYEIEIDGEFIRGNFRSINIANGPYYGGSGHAITTAVPDDGMLDILIGKSAGVFRTLRLISPCVKGRYEKFPAEFIIRRGKKISIRSDSPLLVNLDDESFFDTCFTAEVMPHAIKIVSASNSAAQEKDKPGEKK